MMTVFLILIGTLQQLFGFWLLVQLDEKCSKSASIFFNGQRSDWLILAAILLWPITALLIVMNHYLFVGDDEDTL